MYITAILLLVIVKISEYLILNFVDPVYGENSKIVASILFQLISKLFYLNVILILFVPMLVNKAKFLRSLLQASVLRPFA